MQTESPNNPLSAYRVRFAGMDKARGGYFDFSPLHIKKILWGCKYKYIMSISVTKNWWESQGFLLSVVMIFGSMWGLSEDTATSLVSAVTGLIAAGATVLQFFKTSKFKGIASVLKDGNTLQYLIAAIAVFVPNASALFPSLQGLVGAFMSKNIGLIISALVTAGVMVYNIFFKKDKAGTSAARV